MGELVARAKHAEEDISEGVDVGLGGYGGEVAAVLGGDLAFRAHVAHGSAEVAGHAVIEDHWIALWHVRKKGR